jgi:hypothetical protein
LHFSLAPYASDGDSGSIAAWRLLMVGIGSFG